MSKELNTGGIYDGPPIPIGDGCAFPIDSNTTIDYDRGIVKEIGIS